MRLWICHQNSLIHCTEENLNRSFYSTNMFETLTLLCLQTGRFEQSNHKKAKLQSGKNALQTNCQTILVTFKKSYKFRLKLAQIIDVNQTAQGEFKMIISLEFFCYKT